MWIRFLIPNTEADPQSCSLYPDQQHWVKKHNNFEALFNDKYTEIADFQSSKIFIVNINNNKNKGVIANENIEKGTLLAISNAMSTNCDFKNDNYSIKYNFLICPTVLKGRSFAAYLAIELGTNSSPEMSLKLCVSLFFLHL